MTSVATIYHCSYFLARDDLGSSSYASVPALNQPLLQETEVENDIQKVKSGHWICVCMYMYVFIHIDRSIVYLYL